MAAGSASKTVDMKGGEMFEEKGAKTAASSAASWVVSSAARTAVYLDAWSAEMMALGLLSVSMVFEMAEQMIVTVNLVASWVA
jgi:hypothetical protein